MNFLWNLNQWAGLATWFAGFGTLTVSVVALYLAHRQEPVHLRISVMARDSFKTLPVFVNCKIENVGKGPVTITTTDWAVGNRRSLKIAAVELTLRQTSYPREIASGHFLWARCDYTTLFNALLQAGVASRDISKLRLRVHTVGGKVHKFHPGNDLIQLLREDFQKPG